MTVLSETLLICREFAEVAPDVRSLLSERMQRKSFAKGEQLIRQGDAGDCLLLLVEGSATVSLLQTDGTERVLAFVKPGELVGEMALLTKERRSANVWAETDGVVLTLATGDFDSLVNEHPEVSVVLTNLVAERLGNKQVDALGGKQLDRFKIRRCIGRGSMAVVYEADDIDRDQRVALKMMSHRLVYAPGARERFEREGEILLGFRHPNIARMYRTFDAFKTRFIAMELCDGPALSTLLRSIGPMDEATTRGVLGQLAGAIQCLHDRGIAHRDLKPGNAMFRLDGTLKLMDFGLALPGVGTDTAPAEALGSIVGTPMYMAPELFDGAPPSLEADRYALGCIAYVLLTGRLPFKTTDLYELIELKQTLVVPPRQQIGGGISKELHELIVRLLAPDPIERAFDLNAVATWTRPFARAPLAEAIARNTGEKIVRL